MKSYLHILAEKYQSIYEDTPVFTGDYDPSKVAPDIKLHQPTVKDPTKKPEPTSYAIGKHAEKSGKDIVDVTREILDKVKSTVFTANPSKTGSGDDLWFPGTPEEFRDKVQDIVVDVCGLPDSARHKVGPAHYAARTIENDILKVTKVKSGGQVRTSTPKVNAAAVSPVVQDAVQDVVDTASALPEEPKVEPVLKAPSFNLGETYVVDDTMSATSFGKIANNWRRANAEDAYKELMSGIGAGIAASGKDMINSISGISGYSVKKQALTDLLNVGGIFKEGEEYEGEAKEDSGIPILPPADEADVKKTLEDEADDLRRTSLGGMTQRHGIE